MQDLTADIVSKHIYITPNPAEFGVTIESAVEILESEEGIAEILSFGELSWLAQELIKYLFAEAELFIVDTNASVENDKFILENTKFNTGKIINSHLKNAEKYCFFFATLGSSISNRIKYFQKISDSLNSYLLHNLASEVVEKLVDFMHYSVFKSIEPDMVAGNRVSPGYCGWDVSEQKKFFGLFPGKKINISLTESSLMIPDKSVTGIWGFGGDFEKLEYNCNKCTAEMCYKKFRG